MSAPQASSSTPTATASLGNPFREMAEAQKHANESCAKAAEPLSYYWLKQDSVKSGRGWTPFRKRDNAALEKALTALATTSHGTDAEVPVLVEGGRYQVDIRDRQLRAVYWDKDVRKVLRASWFSKPATSLPGSGGYVPYEESDAAAIEEMYQAALDESVRSLSAGSFLETSPRDAEASATSSASKDAAALSRSASTSGSGSGKHVLLRKEVELADKVHKVVVTVKEVSGAGSQEENQAGRGESSSVPAPSASAFTVATLPGAEIEMVQQRISYGIGVLHNRLLRRGYEDEKVPTTASRPTASGEAATKKGASLSPLEVDEQEEDDSMDREPDHLVFVVHGIGEKLWSSNSMQGMLSLRASVEQLRINALAQRVRHVETAGGVCGARSGKDDDQADAQTLPKTDKETEVHTGKKARTEFLPIEWFDALRGDADGEGELMRRIQRVTLDTVPLFRQLANDCVLDVLLYMNPRYRQKIVATVAARINAAYNLFCQHHPGFHGNRKVSVIGHSLGSVVLFDLLAHQKSAREDEASFLLPSDSNITFPQLDFSVDLFMTLGSPVGMFLCVREQELSVSFRFPTAKRFFNVFHPFDPVAYRLEPLLQSTLARLPPALVPHHGGPGCKTFVTKAREQKRLVTGSLSALSLSVSAGAKTLLGSLSSLTAAKPAIAAGGHQEMLSLRKSASSSSVIDSSYATDGKPRSLDDDELHAEGKPDVSALKINSGQRVDYALQELVSEQINEYVSSIASHSCYFASPDVAYFITQLVYGLDGAGRQCEKSAVDTDRGMPNEGEENDALLQPL
ncbi:triglyceride lipase [Nannochloropsis gaditana]|uniref:Triglyceride lipase n=1 Tax=Nannochloropsis gaditana TaxID=72520 RepID=W7TSJ6_9STRA|nr:triglyceride lipase [Nannochloropsis gaditana]